MDAAPQSAIEDPGSEPELIPVVINGKSYATTIRSGVQRFVANGAVDHLVDFVIFSSSAESRDAYNSIVLKVLKGEISLADYIEFLTLCSGSLTHFEDALASLIDLNPQRFSGSYEELVTIENPLWS